MRKPKEPLLFRQNLTERHLKKYSYKMFLGVLVAEVGLKQQPDGRYDPLTDCYSASNITASLPPQQKTIALTLAEQIRPIFESDLRRAGWSRQFVGQRETWYRPN